VVAQRPSTLSRQATNGRERDHAAGPRRAGEPGWNLGIDAQQDSEIESFGYNEKYGRENFRDVAANERESIFRGMAIRGWSGTTHLQPPGYTGEKPENIRPGDLAVCRKGKASIFR
jgi:hypothetical protein